MCLVRKDLQDFDAAKLFLHYCKLVTNESGQPTRQVSQDKASHTTSGATPTEVLFLTYLINSCKLFYLKKKDKVSSFFKVDAPQAKRKTTRDDVERRLLVLEKLEKEDVSKVK